MPATLLQAMTSTNPVNAPSIAMNPNTGVATGPGMARDQAQLHWVVQYGGHDRDGCRCLSGSNGCRRIEGQDQIGLQRPHQCHRPAAALHLHEVGLDAVDGQLGKPLRDENLRLALALPPHELA